MTYRDDHDAAIARARALENELERVRSERDELEAKVARLGDAGAGAAPHATHRLAAAEQDAELADDLAQAVQSGYRSPPYCSKSTRRRRHSVGARRARSTDRVASIVLRLAICLLVVGCGASRGRVAHAEPGRATSPPAEPRAVVRVHIVGADQVPAAELTQVVCIDKPEHTQRIQGCTGERAVAHGPLTQKQVVDFDVVLLELALWDRGYAKAQVDAVVIPAPDGSTDVTFKVEEGMRYQIAKVEVVDLDDDGHTSVGVLSDAGPEQASLRATRGAWFSRLTLGIGLDRLRGAYEDAGFAFVDATPDFSFDDQSRTVGVLIRIRRGAAATFGAIHILPEKVRTIVEPILQSVGIAPAARYGRSKLETAKRALRRATGRRVDLSVTTARTDATKLDLRVELAPAS